MPLVLYSRPKEKKLFIGCAWNITRTLVDILKAKKLLKKYACESDTGFLFVCDHIGDSVVAAGFIRELKRFHKIERLVVFTTEKFEPLFSSVLSAQDKASFLPKKKLGLVCSLGMTRIGSSVLSRMKNVWVVNPANAFTENFFEYPARFPNLTFFDCIKYGCLKLAENCTFNAPIYIEENDKNSSETNVLVCPSARVSDDMSEEKVRLCVDFFEDRKIKVDVNRTSSSSLESLFRKVGKNTLVIGARSGLLDLLSFRPCRIVAVYSDSSIYMDFFNLEKLPERKAKVLQIREKELSKNFLEKQIG